MEHGYPHDPTVQTGVQYPYENYYVSGPNPTPGLMSAYRPSDVRLHAPIAAPIPAYVIQDAADAQTLRKPRLRPYPVQQVPINPEYTFAPGYQAPVAMMNRGWSQAFVPEQGPGPRLNAAAPHVELSQPIRWDLSYSVDQQVHKPVKGRAPATH